MIIKQNLPGGLIHSNYLASMCIRLIIQACSILDEAQSLSCFNGLAPCITSILKVWDLRFCFVEHTLAKRSGE